MGPLVALVAVSVFLPLGACYLFLRWPLVLVPLAAAAAALCYLTLRGVSIPAGSKPTPAEYLLALLNLTAEFAAVAGFALMYYAGFYWGVRAINRLAGLHWDPRVIGLWASLVLVVPLAATFAPTSVRRLVTRLYPNTAGVPSAFKDILTLGQRRLAIDAARNLFVAIIVTYGLGQIWGWRAAYLGAMVFVIATGQFELRDAEEEGKGPVDLVKAVGKALEAKGYDVLANPRTGKPEVDPEGCRNLRFAPQ